jgi:hypothetical protein
LLNDEETIFYGIFEEMKKQFPVLEQHQREYYDIDEAYIKEAFPELKNPADLRNTLKINSIEISLLAKDNYAFIIMHFECSWDIEHGCCLVIHKDKVVQFNNEDAWKAEVLVEDKESYQNFVKAYNDQIYSRGIYYFPHPKYNQLKPSQIRANKLYPYHLIHDNKNEEFIKAIESNLFNINSCMYDSLLEAAGAHNNEVLFKYILSQKPDNISGALESLAHNTNKYLLNDLLTYGVNSIGKYSFLEECIRVFLTTTDRYILLKIEQAIKTLLEQGITIESINGRSTVEFIKASKSENAKRLLAIIS